MIKFGEKFAKIWPDECSCTLTEFGKKLLSKCAKIKKQSDADVNIEDIIRKSSNFPIEFGTDTCRVQSQPSERHIAIKNQIASAYPVLHERAIYLYIEFLEHQCRHAQMYFISQVDIVLIPLNENILVVYSDIFLNVSQMTKFGPDFSISWPVDIDQPQFTNFGRQLIEKCRTIKAPDKKIDLKQFTRVSSNFPIEFGTNTCRIYGQPKNRYHIIEQQVASAYPIIHERVLWLYLNFLEHKCRDGNKFEKEIFSKLSLTEFVQRLLSKRCVSFFGKNDKYLLISREQGCSGFMTIGTEAQKEPLVLNDVLCYDEIKLSALLSVSSHSEFLNDGNRQNVGVIEMDKSKIERSGVIIGLIGARLSRRDVMEFQDIVISKSQNTVTNGYGKTDENTRESSYRQIWRNFYEERDFLFEQVTKDGKRFGDSKNKLDIFDNLIMKKRYAISFDTLLLESEAKAAVAGKLAYIHVVGIGLGVWKTAPQQEEIFLLTFAERLKILMPQLKHIGFLHFSWFSMTECGDLKHGGIIESQAHPNGGIRTYLSKRNPADRLERPEHENTLLIVSYAWDGNALPGNEFWMKMLKSTGDSSTACSTLITELHNPHINSKFVCGENLHIASLKYGVIHIADYAKKVLNL